jgi:hypothetical protein
MHAIILHVDTIPLIQKIRHQDHSVEYLKFRRLKKRNDFPDQPFYQKITKSSFFQIKNSLLDILEQLLNHMD